MERQSLVNRVRALAEALEGSQVGELDLTEDGLRVMIRRGLEAQVIAPPARRSVASRPRGGARSRSGESANNTAAATSAAEQGIAVLAPLTGVYYGSPSPTSAAFVQVGDPVQVGQVICIVEAMKVFNEIAAEVSGVVTVILPQNGQLVQKGEALIRVKSV
ncbi:MAG: biotin/lipoyl-containing protein [Ktedonobacterales bacterium]